MKKALFVVTLLLLWASLAFGQRPAAAFSASESHEEGSIDLSTLVPSFTFPVISKSVGVLPGSITLESPQSCFIGSVSGMGQSPWRCGFSNTDPGVSFYPIVSNLIGMTPTWTSSVLGACTTYFVNGLSGSDGLSFYPLSLTIYYPSTCGAVFGTATTDDNSGITATITAAGGNGPILSTWHNAAGWSGSIASGCSWAITDPFSNSVNVDLCGGASNGLTDSLGALTNYNGTTGGLPNQYSYTDTSGTSQNVTLNAGTASTYVPLGSACGLQGTGGVGNVTPITSISYPDSTSVGLHWQTNGTGLSGLIDKVTLRTGGQITYTYGTLLDSGCLDSTHSISIWAFNSLKRTTPDGEWDYTATNTSGVGTAGTITTTILDPGKNKTVLTFVTASIVSIPYLASVYKYQNTGTVSTPTYTLLSNSSYCYNGSATCPPTSSAVPSYPITQYDIYNYIGTGSTALNHEEQTYDSTYGNILTDANTELTTTPNVTLTTTYVYGTWSGTSCVAITNTAIQDHPCTITTKNGSTQLTLESLTYNANGAVTADATWISGTDTLTTNYTRNSTGTPATITFPNGQVITNTFGSCNSLMLTDSTTTINSVAIDNKSTWNCNGGVVTDTTDPNSNEADYTYDSMNRPATFTDPTEFVYNYSYPTSTSFKTNWSMSSPSASSATTFTVDSMGRLVNTQTTHGSNYDTLSASYAWNGTNFQMQVSEPCSTTTIGATGCTTFPHTLTIDPLGRLMTAVTTSNETLTGAYSANDASMALSPHPSGENNKTSQVELNGFGQPKSHCGLLGSGGSSCGQSMGNNGIVTTFAYSYATGSFTTAATRGSQTQTLVYDAIGRLTSETFPESGTKTYVYDSRAANYCNSGDAAYTSAGNLVATTDGASNKLCYKYDGLNRVTDITNNNEVTNSGNTYCRRYRYDSTANAIHTVSETINNLIGRMFEAETDDCASTPTLKTDIELGYDADGRLNAEWNLTPLFSSYYGSNADIYANGVYSSLPAIQDGPFKVSLDSDGKPTSSAWGPNTPTTLVNGITYDSGGRPTTVQVFNSNDSDTYGFDSNTGNVNATSFKVNGTTLSVNPSWNSNGTLSSLAVTDGFNSGGTQGCAYGYDDVGRLSSVANASGSTCGATETFTYDQFNNLTQSGTFSWNPGYSSTTNQETGATYDNAGNELKDGVNTYTWDAFGKMVSARAGNSAAVCGTSGTCVIYNALGKIAELNIAGNKRDFFYYPMGVVNWYDSANGGAFMVRLPQPGGGEIYGTGSTDQTLTYNHPDWLGTTRLTTSSGRSVVYDSAYAPYGQLYDTFGTYDQYNTSFTGDHQDVFSNLFDTPNRELFQNAGRFRSCDPIHSGWNCYAYPTNPLTQTDRSGLSPCDDDLTECTDAYLGGDFPEAEQQADEQGPEKAANKPLIDVIVDEIVGLLGNLFNEGGVASPDSPYPPMGGLGGSGMGITEGLNRGGPGSYRSTAPACMAHVNSCKGGKVGAVQEHPEVAGFFNPYPKVNRTKESKVGNFYAENTNPGHADIFGILGPFGPGPFNYLTIASFPTKPACLGDTVPTCSVVREAIGVAGPTVPSVMKEIGSFENERYWHILYTYDPDDSTLLFGGHKGSQKYGALSCRQLAQPEPVTGPGPCD